jgi:predicted DCC family thiol-disulfide oxidoreductase YuxK
MSTDGNKSMKLRIFHDGQCPLCNAEITQLKAYDVNRQLEFVDINTPGFITRYPYIDPVLANRRLHGETANGNMLYGLDVTCLAWQSVNKYPWLAALRWPVIRWFADAAYVLFARFRQPLSRLLKPILVKSRNQ